MSPREVTPEQEFSGSLQLLTNDTDKFSLPHRIHKHDKIDSATLSKRYQELRNAAQPADILLTFLPTSTFSRLIALVDGGPWSHAALVTERMTVIEAVTSGVREMPLDHYTALPFRLGLF